MRRTTLAAALAIVGVLAALAAATPAWAHNQLIDADPAPDAVLHTAPSGVELVFAERLDPTYTLIVVTDADEEPVPSTDPDVDGTRGTVRFTAPLDSGVYTVAFRVNSDDGHPVQSSYEFTVALDRETAPEDDTEADDVVIEDADVDADAGTGAAAGEGAGPGAGTLAAVAGGLVLLAVTAAGLLWWLRGRARE
jgi:copper resistance protein C